MANEKEYAKNLLMALYENDMIEPHKNFMCGEDVNTIEDGLIKLIDWYESEGKTSIETPATLPIFSVNVALPKCTNCGKLMHLAAFQCKCGVVKEA